MWRYLYKYEQDFSFTILYIREKVIYKNIPDKYSKVKTTNFVLKILINRVKFLIFK